MNTFLFLFDIIIVAILITTFIPSPTKEEFEELPPFFARMSPADLTARQALTREEYYERYRSSVRDLSEPQQIIMQDAIEAANTLLSNYPLLNKLPWKIKYIPPTIENGYPHTLEDTIYVSDDLFTRPTKLIIQTMIHEKIHVFQRTYPYIIKEIYTSWGFTPSTKTHPLQRNNPDLDGINYAYKEKYVILEKYNNQTPSSISDSKTIAISNKNEIKITSASMLGFPDEHVQQLEHPNEIMACLVSSVIASKTDITTLTPMVQKCFQLLHELQ